MKMSPLQVCHEGSNWEADGGARFDCLSMDGEMEGEAHPQGRTEGPQAWSDSTEAIEQRGKDGKTS